MLARMQQVGQIGKLITGAAQGSANERAGENNQASERNRLLAQIYGVKQNATSNALHSQSAEALAQRGQQLDERKFALSAPSVRANQSVRGSILANAQPMTLSGLSDKIHVPTISGGLTPAMFSADTRALGSEMSRKALIDQLKGDDFAPMEKTNFQSGILNDPKLEAYKQSGLLEKILGGLGLAGSIVGAVGEGFGADGGAAKRRSMGNMDMFGEDV